MLTPEPIAIEGSDGMRQCLRIPATLPGGCWLLDREAFGDAVTARAVVAVPGFGKGVRAEGGTGLGRHDVVDPAVVGAVVEVVDPLVALVAQPAIVLEADGPCHGGARYTRTRRGRPLGRPLQDLAGKRLEVRVIPGRGHLPVGWSRGCLAGICQVVQRPLAASHLQGPETLMNQFDHLLSLVPHMKAQPGEKVEAIQSPDGPNSSGRSGGAIPRISSTSSGPASGPTAPMATRYA